ncbi:hypothetical protein [Amycolatopsis kentuckyensis]|uniref:hypothetical protein n=1 Tax=Amycolatopsis kentuckyensis TaxID=218823 RepID=UPI001FC93D89|nr:hypothetical protein [Amycolatopsis kentuckyensis]
MLGATMADEGWRFVRAFRTKDENGKPTDLVVGLVEVRGGRVEPAIKIDGKTALIPLEDIGSALPEVLRRTLAEWWKREGGR